MRPLARVALACLTPAVIISTPVPGQAGVPSTVSGTARVGTPSQHAPYEAADHEAIRASTPALRKAAPRFIRSLKTMSDMRQLWRFLAKNRGRTVYLSIDGKGEAHIDRKRRTADITYRIPQDDGYPWVETLTISDGRVDPRTLIIEKYGVVQLGGFVIPLNDTAGAGYWMWNLQSTTGR